MLSKSVQHRNKFDLVVLLYEVLKTLTCVPTTGTSSMSSLYPSPVRHISSVPRHPGYLLDSVQPHGGVFALVLQILAASCRDINEGPDGVLVLYPVVGDGDA